MHWTVISVLQTEEYINIHSDEDTGLVKCQKVKGVNAATSCVVFWCCYHLVFTSTQLEGLYMYMVCWLKSKECMSHIVIRFSTVVHTVNWDAIDKVEQRVSTDPFMVPSSDSWSACTATYRIALWALAACRQVWWCTWNLGCKFKGGQFQTPVIAIELAMGSNYDIPFSIIRGHLFFLRSCNWANGLTSNRGIPALFIS